MSEIIGREKEVKELKTLYLSHKSEFVAIYGRRRVGKTYLVDKVFNEYFGDFVRVITLDDLFA
ncbi:MAG: hypothetical protein K6F33_13305 [Bacteroidales bacterium]|nr:hypothetical protein [Bacteroidales bacterium]